MFSSLVLPAVSNNWGIYCFQNTQGLILGPWPVVEVFTFNVRYSRPSAVCSGQKVGVHDPSTFKLGFLEKSKNYLHSLPHDKVPFFKLFTTVLIYLFMCETISLFFFGLILQRLIMWGGGVRWSFLLFYASILDTFLGFSLFLLPAISFRLAMVFFWKS